MINLESLSMARGRMTLALLVLSGVLVAAAGPAAASQLPGPTLLAQAQFSPGPPAYPPPPTPPMPPAPNQPAAPAADTAVGTVATLQGSASVTRNNATAPLNLNDALYMSDVLQTAPDGTLGVTFNDDTTFTLKPNSRIAVDDFVYQDGGAGNAATFNVLRGTVAFVAAAVAKTGSMRIDTPTATLGIRGTTGLVEIPEAGGTPGEADIKLYPDADGQVGRIEVFGRDGVQLGTLTRGASGFAVRPGAGGRFTAVTLQISPEEEARDRGFVRQAFTAQLVGRQMNIQRRNLRQQRNQLQRGGRPGQPMRGGPQPQRRPGFLPQGRPRYPAQKRNQNR